MKALSVTDQIFLHLETRTQPMHVGGLLLFSFPEGAGPKFTSELAESLRSFDQPNGLFKQRPVTRLGKYYWAEDEMFDFEHHFRHGALPKPGRIRELLSLVSVKHGTLLDRERPLWEAHLVEGIRGKQFAMYFKMHHALIDGVAGMRMAMRMLTEDPNKTSQPPIWAMPDLERRSKEHAQPTGLIGNLSELVSSTAKQVSSLPHLIKEVANMSSDTKDHVSWFQAPSCILNQPITGSRRFAAQSYKLERFKAIAHKADATLNDIVVSVCGSALRNYLQSQNALPVKPLIAMIPMSIRKDDSLSGNQITTFLANLGTHISDPARRVELVKRSIHESKERYSEMSSEELIRFNLIAQTPTLINALTGVSDKLMAYNVVISNVPGPKKTMYWNGAKLEGMYPVSIPMDRAALNITLMSYDDQLEFGFTACRRSLPSMQRLLDYVEQGIQELEAAY